ncbi:saccharopine dehydrogenase NADP-binding domain-containing protein [Candidatus Poribacteria bacterium]|nr:saccharopine dehydrogenase NADP-binding domain-containing protein [Candidatus Poribacteria bacterium]
MDRKKIVVLGGCGQAGRAIVRLLLERTDASVVIAGRSLEKAQALANDMRRMHAGAQVAASCADAVKPASLGDAFRGADIVIVASTTANFTANVVRACLDARCDYFDILDSPEVADILNQFAQQAKKAGRLFITQGGLAPGMPAAIVRLAHASLDNLRGARLGLALSLKTAERYEQVYDVFDFIVKTRPVAFEGGVWRKKSLGDTTTIDYGDRFGSRQSFAIDMPELHALPEQLGLEDLSIYAASPNQMVDYLLKKLIMGLHRIRPRLGWPTLARLIFRASKQMAHEPSGFSNVLEAWGQRNGVDRRLRIVIEHEDNYFATAVTVIAFLRQYFSGAFKETKGVRMMGHLIDPERSLHEIQEMGVTVRREGF